MKLTVEEAAREYVRENVTTIPFGCDEQVKGDFIAGAEWQARQSPWISVEDSLPPIGMDVIHTDISTGKVLYGQINKVDNGEIYGWTPYGERTATHYMYVPSLPFDDILEANKDVLQ